MSLSSEISMGDMQRALDLLRAGEVVAVPTETVYGLAADATQATAVAKIFSIKNRPTFDPLIVHVPDLAAASELVTDFPRPLRLLAEKFWPGPLTLALPKQPQVLDLVTSGLPTVAVRVPRHGQLQALLRAFGRPLAAPSANQFGRISPTTAAAVREELGEAVPFIWDGGACEIGLESTIIGWAEGEPLLLRRGGLPVEEIEVITGPLRVVRATVDAPLAPGNLLQHYAPGKILRLVNRLEEVGHSERHRLGALTFGAADGAGFAAVRSLSGRADLTEAAANFFQLLRELDASEAEALVAVRLPSVGLGSAMNERLERASVRHVEHS